MSKRIMIVEDEILVALELEAMIEDCGLEPIGIAPDTRAAFQLVLQKPDIALVDINLRDGATGIDIGRRLARHHGVRVVFTSANPGLLGEGIDGTVGYLPKPYRFEQIVALLDYLGQNSPVGEMPPPPDLTLFQDRGLTA